MGSDFNRNAYELIVRRVLYTTTTSNLISSHWVGCTAYPKWPTKNSAVTIDQRPKTRNLRSFRDILTILPVTPLRFEPPPHHKISWSNCKVISVG